MSVALLSGTIIARRAGQWARRGWREWAERDRERVNRCTCRMSVLWTPSFGPRYDGGMVESDWTMARTVRGVRREQHWGQMVTSWQRSGS